MGYRDPPEVTTMPPKAEKNQPVALEEMSAEQLEALKATTLEQIASIRASWSGLVALSEKERRKHPGRVALVMETPFRTLFELLTPGHDAGKSPDEQQQRQQLRGIFNSTLGAQDDGDDDERFESELLLQHLARMNAAYEVSEQLDELSRLFSDDALHTAGRVVSPGLKALDLARSVGRTNPTLKGLLAGLLDSLRQMTKAARTKKTQLGSLA